MALPRAAILVVAIGLGGCGPVVEGWRSVSGINVNDPNPETAPFTRNLASAEATAYPNLADVPPPPTRATTAAERQKLAQSLVADRNATAARVAALPQAAAPGATPIGAASPQQAAANDTPAGARRAGEPREPLPQDSALVMPQVRSLPEPETARPAPPAPALATLPRAAPAPGPPPAEVAATPAPAPPVPVMAPIVPPPAAVRGEPKRPTIVATLDIAAGQDRADIERVAALYRATPGALKVIGYAAPPAAGGDPFGSYRAVLERTQAVAKELADAGIPAGKIQTEAAPTAGGRAAGRIEIQFVP